MKRPDFPEISYADWRRQVDSDPSHHADGVDFDSLCTAAHPERGPAALLAKPHSLLQSALPEQVTWVPCQTFDQGDLKKLNHHLKSDLSNGVAGIWLRLDRAVRLGQDPRSSRVVGIEGASLYRKNDFADAFLDTPESWSTLLLDTGGSFLPSTAQLLGWLEDSGRSLDGKVLLLGADPLGALARDGGLPAPFRRLGDDLAELTAYSQAGGVGIRSLAVNTQVYREAGAEIDQELAIALATGAEYLRTLEERRVGPGAVAAEMTFITSTGQQIFLEIAKLRALRLLWSQVLIACGVDQPSHPWIHAAVLRRSLPAREPSLNLLRCTDSSLAAILGGADSVETPGYDSQSPDSGSDRGRRLARNTQLILGLEAQVGRVVDPGRGSYFLESVTQELLGKGWALFQEIEREGGLLQTLSTGWLQDAIGVRWDRRFEALEQGKIPLTGVNIYTDASSPFPEPREETRSEIEATIRQRFLARGDTVTSQKPLIPPESGGNWPWCQRAAADNRAVTEMSSALYGTEEGPVVEALRPRRDSEPFETEPVKS